ncbi:MAG: SIMPL domain-containing protein [Candidatus Micrarchaeota archaeon]|nr:SIMPL domain-containing protein [Candidatus Micrarchaeota archaeon]
MKSENLFAIVGLIAIIALAAAVLVAVAYPGGVKGPQERFITVYASGLASAVPQQGVVYIVVNGTGPTSQSAVQNLTATMTSLNTTLVKYVNGNYSNIATQSYYVYKRYNATGYEATESVTVQVPNVSTTSSLLGAVSLIPNAYVQGVNSKLSDWQENALRTMALQNAVENATTQAQAVAGPSATVTPANITVSNFQVYPYGLASASNAAGPAYYQGTGKVVVQISAMFRYG